MSDKAGTSPQAIPLPSGGGAVAGIGETFTPDPFTGTGNMTVPITLPPGRNGFQPTLDLVYSSGAGNGPFGLGWALGPAGIARKTSAGVPRYGVHGRDPEKEDVFVLAGSDELVSVDGTDGDGLRYRPRTDTAFARIEHITGAAGDVWRVGTKDGNSNLYGDAGDEEPAVVADPADRTRIFSWHLARTTDPFGNRIDYRYRRDAGAEGPHEWDQIYLDDIRYVDVERDGRTRFLVSVKFVYAQRPDDLSDRRAGFEVRTRLRCTSIEVRSHADEDQLTRVYELAYVDERVKAGDLSAASLPASGVSLLSSVTLVGHDGSRTERLPPLEFGYTAFSPERHRFQALSGDGAGLPAGSLADDRFELVDLFADGLPDLIEMDGAARFWRNLGDGRFDAPRPMDEVPAQVRLGDAGVQLADMNGDGRADLLALGQGGYFPLAFQGRWSAQAFVRYPVAPVVGFGDDELRLVDLDGDGVVDALRTAERLELFFNDPRRGWEGVETRIREPAEQFPDVRFSDPRVKLGDMTGDGLQDVVLVRPGRVDYWPSLGHGRWGRRITMDDSPVFGDAGADFDPRRVLLGDLDGDGVADLAYVEPGRLTVWINRGGAGWSDPSAIDGAPPLSEPDAVRLVDLLGSGTVGVLWTFDQVPGAGGNHRFLDLTGSLKPYLLEAFDNSIGARTRIGYAPSTSFRARDFPQPPTRWATPLPFPVQVVERVEVIDEVSGGKLTTEYRYHHGYWDGAEREFRGFGLVDRIDTESFDRFSAPGPSGSAAFARVDKLHFSPPMLTRTWFHLGPVGEESGARDEAPLAAGFWAGDPPLLGRPAALTDLLGAVPQRERADVFRALRGQALRSEVYALDGTDRVGRPVSVTEASFSVRREVPSGDAGRPGVFFPHVVAQRTTQWERGDDPLSSFTFSAGYDAFGQPRRLTEVACPRGWRDLSDEPAQPYLATRLELDFAVPADSSRHLHDRVARRTLREITGTAGMRVPAIARLEDGDARLVPVSHSVSFYDGPAFTGLPFGDAGSFGALSRRATLVFTEALLRSALADGDDGDALPPYLRSETAVTWTDEYPPAFRATVAPLAGYVLEAGDEAHLPGYYAHTTRVRYDFQDDPQGAGRGMALASRPALGTAAGERDTVVGYDEFDLLPVAMRDPAGLETTAEHDYRVFQARLVTDVNGNRSAFAYTPLGFLERSALLGKPGDATGDTLARPASLLRYDFGGATAGGRRPASVRTVRRIHHANAVDVPPARRSDMIESVSYSDGFGRVIQVRAQAEDTSFGDALFGGGVLPPHPDESEPGPIVGRPADPEHPSVVVSGARTYDNKGRVVERFEPYFAAGWEYAPPGERETGMRVTTFWDPMGRVARVVGPDGSEQRIVAGVPVDLDDPDTFAPTPWESFAYDADDNAGRTHGAEAQEYEHRRNTPASFVVDALGRTVTTVERLRAPGASGPPAELITRFSYDVGGNLLAVTDPLGRRASGFAYDLANRPLRRESLDAGLRRTVPDASGHELERRDGRDALILQAYDLCNRRARLWSRDDGRSEVTLREELRYGDGGVPAQPALERTAARAANLLGALHEHLDEAGLTRFLRYDGDGAMVERERRVFADAVIASAFTSGGDSADDWRPVAFRVDWEPPAGTSRDDHANAVLDDTVHAVSATYDALGQVRTVRTPEAVDGRRRELRVEYDRAGALEQIRLDGDVVVDRMTYDAKGERTLMTLGNGVMTRFAHDARTSRLIRLRSEHFTSADSAEGTYTPTGEPLQDLELRYDLAGNVLEQIERVQGAGVRANPQAGAIADPALRALAAAGDALVRRFGYDSLSRLVSATGRECSAGAPSEPWADAARCTSTRATPNQSNGSSLAGDYRESYTYDDAGNLRRLRHAGANPFTRDFVLEGDTDRLRRMKAGASTFAYRHDANGNVVGETASRQFTWDHADRLVAFATRAGTEEPSLQAQYLYDAEGQRVKKVVRRQGGALESTTYIEELFERHRWQPTATQGDANDHLQVAVSGQRVARLRIGPPHPDDLGPPVRYQLADHLGTVAVTVDGEGRFVEREEHTPYGETSFGGFARKRYRFCGKEREESGLYYHGARYYAAGLGRWVSPDPIGLSGGLNPYSYARANPVSVADPTGLQPESETLTITEGHKTWSGTEAGMERVDWPALALGSEQAWKEGWVDWDVISLGSDEIIEIQDQSEVINGNIFSNLDGEYWILMAGEQSARKVSKEAYGNAVYWSNKIEGMSEKQLSQAFGAVEALGRGMEIVTLVGMSAIPAGRAALTAVDAIDGAVAVARADTAGERAWAIGAAVTSVGLPGMTVRAPVGAVASRELTVLRTTGRAVQAEPDVYAISLVRWKGTEVKAADRLRAQATAQRLGHVGPVDVGHAPGHERVFTRPGDEVWLRAEPRGPNRSAGAKRIRPEAARVRRSPHLGIFVRDKR